MVSIVVTDFIDELTKTSITIEVCNFVGTKFLENVSDVVVHVFIHNTLNLTFSASEKAKKKKTNHQLHHSICNRTHLSLFAE